MKLLLTGPPGVGKTTVILKVLKEIKGVATGFYTREMRVKGRRIGFMVRTLAGEEGVFAHVDQRGGPRVGRYGVDIPLFEAIAIPTLESGLRSGGLVVIDEIGKMELFSARFKELVWRIILAEDVHLLGTIKLGADPFVESIKRNKGVEVISVNQGNRGMLPAEILKRITAATTTVMK